MAEAAHGVLDSLLDRQSRSWLAGHRPSIEELLAGTPLRDDSEAQLDLIYNEVVLREELGEELSPEEYARRFPHLRGDLELHFEVHRAVRDAELTATRHTCGADTMTEVEAPLQLPDYDLLEVLGRGGMAVVYKARHRCLRRLVALKMFEPGRVVSPREVLRFRAEAEAIARLQHPNIIQIHEIGERNGLPFLALELADQGTLARRLQQLPFAPRDAAELIEQLARAAHHAHSAGIIHRDLKPANVLFKSESGSATPRPRITDFGLAKVFAIDPDTPRDETRAGDPIGTPRYMAPEQAAGRNDLIGPATDVYALGNLLYECLTGRVPFLATNVVETLDQIRSEEPPPPRRFQPSVPRDLETICLKCLHKEPARRYASAEALADDLRRFLDGRPIMARPTPAWERAWKWCLRNPAWAVLLAVGVLLAAAAAIAFEVRNRAERARVEHVRDEIEAAMKEGQEALARGDEDVAVAQFSDAMTLVQGEPALRDYQTGVAGWLDHARRALSQQRWKQRVPPREYDEKRDEALFLGLLLQGPRDRAISTAREAVAEALELTLPNNPGWRHEREQLVLLDAELVCLKDGAAKALERLDETPGFASRAFHLQRAEYLEGAGRAEDAATERDRATWFPPEEVYARFLTGAALLRRRDYIGAEREFEAVLDAEPEHFTARLFLAICVLRQGRPAEARVGLTACIAQRPRFPWSYLYRAECFRLLGNAAGAKRDVGRADELRHGTR
jgi:hypothetical protein